MFSQTAEYALRAMVWLAEHQSDEPVGNVAIAEATQVPQTFLAKVMQSLVKADLVTSRRGVGGGFVLNRSADEISVLDVVNSVDPIQRFDDCPLKLAGHRRRRCSMHAQMNSAIAKVEKTLGASTIQTLVNDKSRPKPMMPSKK